MSSNVRFLHQSDLERTLVNLFPNHHMVKNARKVACIQTTQQYFLELDFWFPELKLAFEFQDPHHYVSVWNADASPAVFQKRDAKKRSAMAERGESLIVVPCWWDGGTESLLAAIKNERPDLFAEITNNQQTEINSGTLPSPIPVSPPKDFFKEPGIDEIGSLMTPSYPMTFQFDPINWWMGEKYDGIRTYWNSQREEFFSRHGAVISVPEDFRFSIPSSSNLDGELWFGRDGFQETQNITYSRREIACSWEFLRFVVFDVPLTSVPFEARFKNLVPLHLTFPHTVVLSSPMKCESRSHLSNCFSEILRGNGEGLVLRKDGSLYVGGRSNDVVKIKSGRDHEGLVVKVNTDTTTCIVQLADGTNFTAKVSPIFTSNTELNEGDIVTFKYDHFSGTKPVNAVVFRGRTDSPLPRFATRGSKKGTKESEIESQHPRGYWTMDESENVKKFFDQVAKERQMDPSRAESWYDLSWREVTNRKGNGLLAHYDTLINALSSAYPEIHFEIHKFSRVPRNYWKEKSNRRRFLDSIAMEAGFNSLSPSDWYTFLSSDRIFKHKGVWAILEHHQHSLGTALLELYPEIGLSKSSFPSLKKIPPPHSKERELL